MITKLTNPEQTSQQVKPDTLKPAWLLIALVCLVLCFLAGILIGPTNINPLKALLEVADRILPFNWDSGLSDIQAAIVWDIRMPRVILAVLVGAMLSMSGAAYQGIFRNPLADPYLLGIAAGAGLGATAGIVLDLDTNNQWAIPLIAFLGGLLAAMASYVVGTFGSNFGNAKSQHSRLDSSASLILAGVAVASFFTAIQAFLQQRHADTLREVYSWLLGRFSVQGWDEVILLFPYFVVTSFVILMYRRVLDVFEVGEEEAQSLGVDVRFVRLIVLIAASLAASAAVAFSGLIGFVGIVVPHIVRLIFSNSYRSVLPLSLIFGAGFMVLADLIARTLLEPAELPIGVVTAFLGTPVFVYVLYKARLH